MEILILDLINFYFLTYVINKLYRVSIFRIRNTRTGDSVTKLIVNTVVYSSNSFTMPFINF